MKITMLERMLIENIAENLFTSLNGDEPNEAADTVTWVEHVKSDGPHKFITNKQVSGLMSQVVRKGLVYTDTVTCRLTDKGFEVYKEGKVISRHTIIPTVIK